MLRRLFTLLSIISLLLFVATCVMWVRSYWVEDDITYTSVRSLVVASRVGTMHLAVVVQWEQPGGPGSGPKAEHVVSITPRGWTRVAMPVDTSDGRSMMMIDDRWFHYQVGTVTLQQPAWRMTWRGDHKEFSTGPGYRLVQHDLPMPYLLLAILCGAMPTAGLVRAFSRRRRVRNGRCRRCGYDLRATRGRCPECGTVPVAR